MYTFIYFYLVLYLQLVGSEGAYKILPARGIANCIRVCSTLALHFLIFFLFGLVPRAGRIFRRLENTTD